MGSLHHTANHLIIPAGLLLPHVQSIMELIQRCLADSERTDISVRLCAGLIGDLADAFPDGQIKQYLLAEWIANELRTKARLPLETKKTIRWAREVRPVQSFFFTSELTYSA